MAIIGLKDAPRRNQYQPLVDRFGDSAQQANWVRRVFAECTLTLIHAGDGWYRHDRTQYEVIAPAAFLCRPDQLFKFGPNQTWHETHISFSCTWPDLCFRLGREDDDPMLWPIQAPQITSSLCQQLTNLTDAAGLAGIADTVDALATAIYFASQAMDAPPAHDHTTQELLRIAQAWRKHPEDTRSLTDVARSANLSPAHFRRLWHQQFGCAPHQWLNEIRMTTARELLGSGTLSIKAIAARVGFHNPRNFAAAFRRRFTCSPTDWRNTVHGNERTI